VRFAIASIVLAAPLALIPAAHAQSGPYEHAAIQRGDFATAEQKLLAEARVFPNKPEANAVYDRTAKVLQIVKASRITRFGFVGNEQYRAFSRAD
jgi:hypothetical protein